MSARGLLILVVLLAAAVSALVWLGRAPKPKAEVAPDAPLFPKFTEDAVQEIDLTCGASHVTLKRAPVSGWTVTPPKLRGAIPTTVNTVPLILIAAPSASADEPN